LGYAGVAMLLLPLFQAAPFCKQELNIHYEKELKILKSKKIVLDDLIKATAGIQLCCATDEQLTRPPACLVFKFCQYKTLHSL